MKKKFVLIPIAIFSLFILGFTYNNYINVFNANTLQSINLSTPENIEEKHYVLTETERIQLATGIESMKVSTIPDEEATVFNLSLLNRWHLSQHYTLYLVDQNNIYLEHQNSNKVYKISQPDFFLSHEGFDSHYDNALFPDISFKLNNTPIPHVLQSHQWFFKRFSGEWVQKNNRFNHEIIPLELTTLGDDELYVFTDKPFDVMHIKIYDFNQNTLVFEDSLTDQTLPIIPRNGTYHYLVEMVWFGNAVPYKGNALIDFHLTVDLPSSFETNKTIVAQDDFIEIYAYNVKNINDLKVEQSLIPNLNWYPQDGHYKAFIPTNFKTSTGMHPIAITDLSDGSIHTFEIEVLSRDYKVQNLRIDPNIEAATRNDEAFAEYRNYFVPVRLSSNETKQHYEMPFILPSEGRLTTEFGEKRTVNGALTSYRHNGIDIAAPLGTEVLATNHGMVVFEMDMILTGKTIIIDHGSGIFSVYEHLNEILVEKGDFVSKGELIGKIGTTGFSTGPHLHFMISYFDMDMDPGYFIIGEPYTKEKHAQIKR